MCEREGEDECGRERVRVSAKDRVHERELVR